MAEELEIAQEEQRVLRKNFKKKTVFFLFGLIHFPSSFFLSP